MRYYASQTPDIVRGHNQRGTPVAHLPSALDALDLLDNQKYPVDSSTLREHLLNIAAAVALPVKWGRSRTPGADYMLRTSPSGGSRHPSELYLLALNVQNIPRGVYHIGALSKDIGYMGELPTDSTLRKNLPGAYRLPSNPRAIFIITTHFSRNMYRYREPRTLRTVYYDAGHMGGLIESLADSHGTVAQGHHGFSDSFLMNLLNMDSFAIESPSYLVSVGLEKEKIKPAKQVGMSRLNI